MTGLGALSLVDHEYRAQLHLANAQALGQASVDTRNRMHVALTTRLRVVEDLQAFMLASASLPDNETFNRYATGVLGHYPIIRGLAYIDSHRVIRYFSPLKGNEQAIGLDLMTRPAAPFVEKAIRERRTTVNDPTVNVMGSLAVTPRTPLYRGDQLHGLVQGVFDVSAILEEVSTGADPRFAAQLRDANGNRFWGAEMFSGETQTLPVQVGDNAWTLTVGWQSLPPGPAPLTLGLIWGLGGALVLSLLFIVNRVWTQTEWLRTAVFNRTAALRESEARFRSLTELSSDFYWETDIEHRLAQRTESDSGTRESVFHQESPIGQRRWEIPYLSPDESAWQAHRAVLDAHLPFREFVFSRLAADGTERHVSISGDPVFDAAGNFEGYRGVGADITERKRMEEQVRQMAFHDTLTNLPNRRLLNDRLSQAIAVSKRSGCYGALLFLDLDNFKLLNDTHGHEVGDLVLIEVADRLKSCVRETDTVARFGGDEFVVMISELNAHESESTTQAGIIAEKIRAALAKPCVLKIQHEGKPETTVEHQCTASIGGALFGKHEASQDNILKWADTAMYQAKEAGCNLIRFYDSKP